MPGLTVGGFGLPDNLMIPGAVGAAGGAPILLPERFDSLEMFERCVVLAAERYRSTSSTAMPNSARPSESRSPSPSMPQR
jgi:hypothetical protein